MFPVVPGCGGGAPGQNRDKFGPGENPSENHDPPVGEDALFLGPTWDRGRRRCHQRRKGPRSRQEAEDERRQLQEATDRDIDQIVAECPALLPRDKAKVIGAVYARYSSRFQHSISDQVRALFEAALKQDIFIPRSHVFYDMAVRGYKEQRPGLNRLRAVLAGGSIRVFLVFTTNRLFRKTYKALQFVEEEVVERGIRCLFVKSGVDSADKKRWRMLLQIHAMTDEFVVGMYADNVRAAHEGLFDQQLVWSTLSFAYRGEPIPGAFTKRNRPRCRVVIDAEIAPWVQRIFAWYVRDQLSIDEIARRLNADPTIPLGPKSVSGQWTHQPVRGVLKNPRYRGAWEYGATQNVWQSKNDYSRQIPRPEPLRSAQVEELRIVEDELWYEAQKRLAAESKANAGRKPKGGDRRSHPRLLNGLFYCPQHNQSLYVGGAHGQYLFCRPCQCVHAEERPLYSQLPRALALRLTCRKLAALIQEDEELVQQVVSACQQQAAELQQADPAALESLGKQEERLSKQIWFLMQSAGETEADQREAAEQLKLMRRQRAELVVEISRHKTRGQRQIRVPAEPEIHALTRTWETS